MIPELMVGDKISIVKLPSYIKTADPMPMLRSPDILAVGEEGLIIDRRPVAIGVYFLLTRELSY